MDACIVGNYQDLDLVQFLFRARDEDRAKWMSRPSLEGLTKQELIGIVQSRPDPRMGEPSRDIEGLLDAIGARQIIALVSDVYEGPVSAETQRQLRLGGLRGSDRHRDLCESMCLALWGLSAEIDVEGGYCEGYRYDIGCREKMLAVECGNTTCGKIFDACSRGWRVMVLPFWSLVYFTFSPAPGWAEEMGRERETNILRHNATEKVNV
jgi:hypothetical protein